MMLGFGKKTVKTGGQGDELDRILGSMRRYVHKLPCVPMNEEQVVLGWKNDPEVRRMCDEVMENYRRATNGKEPSGQAWDDARRWEADHVRMRHVPGSVEDLMNWAFESEVQIEYVFSNTALGPLGYIRCLDCLRKVVNAYGTDRALIDKGMKELGAEHLVSLYRSDMQDIYEGRHAPQ